MANNLLKHNSKLRLLVSKGRSKGFVTYKEILKAMPDAEENVEALDKLYELLDNSNIQLAEEGDETEILSKEKAIETLEAELKKTNKTTSMDPIRMYLREIGRIKLLTAEQEVQLAQMVEASKYEEALNVLKDDGVTNPTDEQLMETIGIDDKNFLKDYKKQYEKFVKNHELFLMRKARNRLINSNLRLVVSYAKRYMHRGLTFSDLIQEGNIGLMRAVDKFDWRRGFKFSTYATWWIRQAITRAIADQARTIRIPVHMIETIHKLKRAQRELEQKNEREPTTKELAKAMEIEESKVEEILKISQEPSSLQSKIGPDNDTQLSEFIQDTDSAAPEQVASYELLKTQVEDVLGSLSEREKKVLELRFGLKDHNPRTLEDVGKVFGVTRERIRQIEAKALRKLRHPSRSKKLKDYL